jgi:hypothetical protein
MRVFTHTFIVNCHIDSLFCNAMATLKPTKTRRITMRCDTYGVLVLWFEEIQKRYCY